MNFIIPRYKPTIEQDSRLNKNDENDDYVLIRIEIYVITRTARNRQPEDIKNPGNLQKKFFNIK